MHSYRFGSFVLEARERRLLRGGDPISLTPKAFDTLVYLVERHGHLVGKDELLEAIWGGSYVEEGSVSRTIHVLRKALTAGNRGTELDPQYIETVPTKGYRFVADVTPLDGGSPVTDASVPELPRGSKSARDGQSGSWRRAALLATATLVFLALAGLAWRARDSHVAAKPAGAERLMLHTRSGAAYARYQRGRLHLERHLAGDVETALEDFESAIELDPAFAAAYAGKADAKFFRYSITGSHDDIAQARLAIRKAIELDGGGAYAHALQCRLLGTYDWDFAAAQAECRLAVDLDPRNDEARREMGFLLNALGRRSEALKEMDAAIAIAPTSFNKRSRGLLLYFDRRFDDAIAQFRQVETTDPEYPGASRWIARCLEQKREYGAALEAVVRSRESAGAPAEAIVPLRRAFEHLGWPGVLRASLAHRQPAPPALETAGTYAQLGEPDAAFEVLESMVSARRLMIVHMDSEPRLDPVRADPRFEKLARRVGLR
jgi:DNA-binding winged helix-turn-helix (wHTH) protein/Tfp pilus assembly protein PilF